MDFRDVLWFQLLPHQFKIFISPCARQKLEILFHSSFTNDQYAFILCSPETDDDYRLGTHQISNLMLCPGTGEVSVESYRRYVGVKIPVDVLKFFEHLPRGTLVLTIARRFNWTISHKSIILGPVCGVAAKDSGKEPPRVEILGGYDVTYKGEKWYCYSKKHTTHDHRPNTVNY